LRHELARFAAVVVVGFVGWLGAMVLRLEGLWVFVLPVVLGAIAAPIGRRAIMLAGVWIGMLAAYPAALAFGAIAYMGEQWALVAALFMTGAAAGFGAVLVLREMPRRSTETH
jgi:hypothetical protein